HNIADDKLWKPIPNLYYSGLLAFAHIDISCPDVGKNEGPNPDEYIDENFDSSCGTENPALLKINASCCRAREDQRLGNSTAGYGGPVGLDRKSHPGAGYHRLVRKKRLRSKWQDQ